ncbi:AAA family ATPase [Arthrobacter sp. QXT-31]|uniref:AAA family ATPase n=1 Tax=Arthrobacter sp. QXT-31 TaxID=1357915 RepID=UPI000971ABAD|nr:AAA family ATPase [Arthrobacter sp. QXT-31]APX03381.1 hypothetical protein BWQ92_18120 [Arthrobacter sp. QXT-31]
METTTAPNAVQIPARFDETAPRANPWEKTPEQLTAENYELKTLVREAGLMTKDELEAKAAYMARDLEDKATKIFNKRIEASEKFQSWELVEVELANKRAREEANRRYKVENSDADLSLFDSCMDLHTALTMPEEPMEWRVKHLLMVGHITTVTAPAKAGKTVLQVNRVKSYVDGTPLFGRFPVKPVEGNVAVWNYELMPNQMHDWFRRAQIVNRHKIFVMNMRGAGLFIQNEVVLERAIKWLRDNKIEILEIDPLQAAFLGSVNSDEDAADYITALQRLQKESGVKDIILTTHMGHAGKSNAEFERSIGSARWEGFPDNMWIYKREGDTAYLRIDKGRMDPVPEFALTRDPATNMLTHMGDNSGQEASKANDLFREVIRTLADGIQKLKTKDVVEKIAGSATKKKQEVRSILEELSEWGLLTEENVKQESGQKAAMVQMNSSGCGLFRAMIDNKRQVFRPLAVWSDGDPEPQSPLKVIVLQGV